MRGSGTGATKRSPDGVQGTCQTKGEQPPFPLIFPKPCLGVQENFILERTMREVLMLREQLIRHLCESSDYALPEEDEAGVSAADMKGQCGTPVAALDQKGVRWSLWVGCGCRVGVFDVAGDGFWLWLDRFVIAVVVVVEVIVVVVVVVVVVLAGVCGCSCTAVISCSDAFRLRCAVVHWCFCFCV